ncbi:RNA polymerase sigma-70 factor (ECF subfamily) [Actinomadura coerulea]|uniref:RNA polymerase sigma-70 factor (ECF subfamily) n=1 Tax=Actinomadura coerulea TaxID=46159 RepID=A0A7X0L245_9ACTN|nr:sigma-70 family RNA polymerase sigma factor [Actinomadura coerulea]MBB6399167.1 RNA polymerase sigma-70 factor (ECF subfamily) [Actinomadura coerulea]GGQ23880.1 RNA polymerase sigma factor [Actinomadura coerulea]
MHNNEWLAGRFVEHRPHLRSVAYRMLGSLSEADDALQDAWLRASRADTSEVHNLAGWLTTVVARVCLNMLRSREHRGEAPLDVQAADQVLDSASVADPEQEAVMADSVGVALLVVLDTLAPAERLAFVLHDMFAVPFEQIAAMLDRSTDATRQLASRARRRIRGAPAPDTDLYRQRQIVEAFLAATRSGDFQGLVTLLHPDVVLRADEAVIPTPEPVTVAGAEPVARGAMAAVQRARFTGTALIDGAVGLAMAPGGRLRVVLAFTIVDGLVTAIDVIAEPDRLGRLDMGVLG